VSDDWISFTVDGREVRAPEGELLLEAAKRGDVEVPYFCYEPKLGPPVGACRMCLVEIEGIPKLQTSCSTPVKDGMVVYTQTDQVKHAQNAMVEFLLVNHPLDCPVCDKGGECPLQDISYGWGPGRSRFQDQKRNFPKPIALSPLVAIDRERCILCYRCVRFSQEVAEDYQLTFLERGDHTFVGTFDGRPYVAPFAGNIIELCPVGALTNTSYRFRARPWDIVNSGSVCTLCPSQCNIAFTVRDDRVERVLERENDAVDDGWLCDKGRWGYQSIASEDRVVQPLVRDGGRLRPATWEHALGMAAEGLRKAGSASAAIVGGQTTNEEGYLLQRIFREALGSPHVDSGGPAALEPERARLLARPELSASVGDIDGAGCVLVIDTDPINEAPILDLRLRKAVRRFGCRLVVAASGPTALDAGASARLSFAPGTTEAFLRALQKALLEVEASPNGLEERVAEGGGSTESAEDFGIAGQARLATFLAEHSLERLAQIAELDAGELREAAALLTRAENVVVLWGERLGYGREGDAVLGALGDLALVLGLDAGEGSGLIEIPTATNARGLREVGCAPALGLGLTDVERGMTAAEARDAALDGAIGAVYLLHADPVRELPEGERWDEALGKAAFVVAHEQFLGASAERHADVVFPAESYAEKEGTVTHPDGRLQRVRPAIGHPGEVRVEWQLLVELGKLLGLGLEEHVTAGAIFAEIADRSPVYRGITSDEIGGRGLRWQEREESRGASAEMFGPLAFSDPEEPRTAPQPGDGELRLATRRDLWASWETDHAPSLHFLRPRQELVLNPIDAERLGVARGERVRVSSNGNAVEAEVALRESVKHGTGLLTEGTAEQNANTFLNDSNAVVVRINGPSAGEPTDGFSQE
jgi:NADH-quinone oxidoreductase subunit G